MTHYSPHQLAPPAIAAVFDLFLTKELYSELTSRLTSVWDSDDLTWDLALTSVQDLLRFNATNVHQLL